MASGSWALAEELFARGDAAFVAEVRRIHDADRLGGFAARWLADVGARSETGPNARRLLIDYLSLPLNAYRHEALVKRLFKGAEAAGDDELMGLFLVAFDRSIRRQRKKVTRHKWDRFTSLEDAKARQREWQKEGYSLGPISGSLPRAGSAGNFTAYAYKHEEIISARNDAMPRPKWDADERGLRRRIREGTPLVSDAFRQRLERRFILFSQPTRRYLRRRAWRYFRKLGKADIGRYRVAALAYLKRYADADVDSDIHLLDNWGLVHTLFFGSPALLHPAKGWDFAEGKTLADLAPAPRFPAAWTAAPDALLELLTQARCRTVRQWAAWMLRAHQAEWLAQRPVATLLALTNHADPDVAALGFDMLERHADLASVPVETWLARLDGDDLERLQRLSSLLARRLDPGRVTLADAVKLALHRSLPVAGLGRTLLRGAPVGEADVATILPLAQAECETVRPELVHWLLDTLGRFGPPRAEWLLELLDSKHADVRAIGWRRLLETPLKDDPAVWQKLLESPYDDVKGPLVAELTERIRMVDFDAVRMLWASLLLNIHRGGRRKPGVVRQVVDRLAGHPDESDRLLPLLAVAVRSLRGPEFRAGLVGVVTLLERNPDLRPAAAKQFPELQDT